MSAVAEKIRITKEIAAKIDRGAKLSHDIASLEEKKAELDSLKKEFRVIAGDTDLELTSPSGAKVFVEQKNDAIVRMVPDESVARVQQLAGGMLPALFTLHPSKGAETNFTLNALRKLPKRTAAALVDVLTVQATPWVKFRAA